MFRSLFAAPITLTAIAIEYGTVIDRDLDDPQLGPDNTLTIGWQWAF